MEGWKAIWFLGLASVGMFMAQKVWMCGMRMLHGQQAQVFGSLIVFDSSYFEAVYIYIRYMKVYILLKYIQMFWLSVNSKIYLISPNQL